MSLDDFKNLAMEVAQKDQVIDGLEQEVQETKDKRLQERFYFVVALILILDVILLPTCPLNLITFICFVEFLVILCLADKWGVEQVGQWTMRVEALAHKHYDAILARYKRSTTSKNS